MNGKVSNKQNFNEEIKCIDLHLENTSELMTSHPEILEMQNRFFGETSIFFVFQALQIPSRNMRHFFRKGVRDF